MKTSLTQIVVAVLGLVHFVQLMPINDVHAKVEETFLREAMTDGFIIESLFTPPASRGLVMDLSEMTEASGFQEGSGDSTAFGLQRSHSQPSEAAPPNATATSLFSEEEGSGSGFGSGSGLGPGSVSTSVLVRDLGITNQSQSKGPKEGYPPDNTDLSTTAITAVIDVREIEFKEPPTPSKQGAKANSSGWMIIVGFVVGIAALVLVCIAIATKDSWNRPSKAVIEAEGNASNVEHQKQEMKEFLPKEEGHKADYTMVPLSELSEKMPLS